VVDVTLGVLGKILGNGPYTKKPRLDPEHHPRTVRKNRTDIGAPRHAWTVCIGPEELTPTPKEHTNSDTFLDHPLSGKPVKGNEVSSFQSYDRFSPVRGQ